MSSQAPPSHRSDARPWRCRNRDRESSHQPPLVPRGRGSRRAWTRAARRGAGRRRGWAASDRGRRGHPPLPRRRRDPRDRPLAAVQRARRHPGQRGAGRERQQRVHRRAERCSTRTWPQYIHDNTDDEVTHFTFLNAYLEARGGRPVNLEPFRTLPSSTATGAQQIKRLTNLMQLTVDTTWWTRYRSSTKNPDFGGHVPAGRARSDEGSVPGDPAVRRRSRHRRSTSRRSPTPRAFTSRRSSRAARACIRRWRSGSRDPEVLRVLLSIGPTETMHFQTWSDKAGNAPPLTDPTNGLVFPDLNSSPFGGEDFQTNLIMPEPTVFLSRKFPRCSIIRPTETKGAAMGALQVPDRRRPVPRTVAGVLQVHEAAGAERRTLRAAVAPRPTARAPRASARAGAQLAEVALPRRLVIGRRVGHRVAVLRLPRRPRRGSGRRPLRASARGWRSARPLMLGSWSAKPKYSSALHVGRGAVRAVGRVGDQAAGVEAGQRRDPIGKGDGDSPAQPRAHAVAGEGHRAGRSRLGEAVEVGGPSAAIRSGVS